MERQAQTPHRNQAAHNDAPIGRVLVDGQEPQLVELPEKKKIFRDFLLSLTGQNAETFEDESFMLTDVCIKATKSAEQGIFITVESNPSSYPKDR